MRLQPNKRRLARQRCRTGAMLVLIAICLPLCIIMAAFAIDVAWMQLVRTELRTATDAAARAGAKALSLSQNADIAREQAKEAAARNFVAGRPLLLDDADIEIGTAAQASELSRFNFSTGGQRLNAVRVTGKRTQDSASGPVGLLLAGVLGVREFQPVMSATSAQLDRDICLVLDRSGSMMQGVVAGTGGSPGDCKPPGPQSRWNALATAVEAFMAELDKTKQQEFLAMVSYSSDENACGNTYRISQIDADMSSNYQPIRNALAKIGSQPVRGRTAISAGIEDGIRVLTSSQVRPFAAKTMILMTDGLHNTGPEPIIPARVAAENDIVIHTITFSDEADVRRMQDVAAATGGKHFHAPTANDLVRIFKEIASTLPVIVTE